MRKFLCTAVITALLLLPSCFERNDMYDFAKNGVPVIYAVIGTCQGAIIATEEDSSLSKLCSDTISFINVE